MLSVHSKSMRVYALWTKNRAIMGQTPEYLFQKEDLNVRTHALAGTARDPQHDLLKRS